MNVVDSPPGMISPSSPAELLGLPHLDGVGAEAAQHRRVLAKVPLQGKNADPKRLHGLKWYSGLAVALDEPRPDRPDSRHGDAPGASNPVGGATVTVYRPGARCIENAPFAASLARDRRRPRENTT